MQTHGSDGRTTGVLVVLYDDGETEKVTPELTRVFGNMMTFEKV